MIVNAEHCCVSQGFIEDFSISSDFVHLDPALWPGQDLADGDAVLAAFGSVRGGDYVLDFGRHELVLEGITDPTGLGARVEILDV